MQLIDTQLNLFPHGAVSPKKLREGCGISISQLKEDIRYMRENWDAPILYDWKRKGYYYTHPYTLPIHQIPLSKHDIEILRLAVGTLNQYRGLESFKELEGVFDKIEKAVRFRMNKLMPEAQYIHFETVPYFKGSERIEFFLQAIRDRQEVQFEYEKFDPSQINKIHILHPYWLKEHRNRWYAIGWHPASDSPRIFGLDRILPNVHLTLTGRFFERKSDYDLNQFLKHSFGIFIKKGAPVEKVVLDFTLQRKLYFESQPFHAYFKDLGMHGGFYRYEFWLVIEENEELLMEIARMGAGVRVIAPESLKKNVKDYLHRALHQYEP